MRYSYKLKRFSLASYGLRGAAIGGTLGAASGYVSSRKDPQKKKRRILRGAVVGSGVGATLGIGAKHGVNRYKKWVGAPVKSDISEVVKNMKPGDIISADRGAYQHYGIVGRDGKIIEYGSNKFDPRTAHISSVTPEHFSGGSALKLEAPSGNFSRDEIVSRAESWIGKDRGQYNLRNNNCEHFAREMATGQATSTQSEEVMKKFPGIKKAKSVLDKITSLYSQRSYSAFRAVAGDAAIAQQFRHFVGNDLYNVRGKLTKNLGGLSHFNKHQTQYLSGAGSLVGGVSGRIIEGKRAKKDAERYGLKKGTLEYDKYISSRKNKGTLIGAGGGALAGAGLSKGVDWARGKAISDKALVKYGGKLDLGKNYMATGKSLRGITSEKDIETIANNISETGNYVKGLSGML